MPTDNTMTNTQDGWRDTEVNGRQIDRFILREVLGRGGWGVVYRATDPLTTEPVALKVIAVPSRAVRERVAREIAALSIVNDPGIVRLIGHGASAEGIWIAMELVLGDPFPPGAWEQLAPTTLAFAETVARMHRLGIIHRDLKPGNVLVRPDGRPVVLDFGLATGATIGGPLTQEGTVLGTPRYQAPEQLEGRRVDDRADVYAMGVMLYEALSGRLPHAAEDIYSLRSARMLQSPTPIEQIVPAIPTPVAALIRRMLARVPEDRPSAADVALALSGRPLPSDLQLARIDGDALPTHILARLRRGESVDVWGPRRSGRTRLLADVAAQVPAVYATPAERPYASLWGVIGPIEEGSFAEVQEVVRQRLSALTGPLLVDDWEMQDAWTQALLSAVTLPSGQLRVREAPDALRLTPVDASTLAGLFAGPERILHLPSDAAAALLQRTDGWPGRVVDQLQRWLRQARVHQEDGRFVIERDVIDALSGEAIEPPLPERLARTLQVEQEDVLVAARIAWPHATAPLLAAMLGRPQWEVEAQLDDLGRQGCLTGGPAGWIARAEPIGRWAEDRVRRAHQIAATHLPIGAAGRLGHLLAAGDPGPLVVELRAQVDGLIQQGQVRRAIPLLWSLRSLVPDQTDVVARLVALLLEQRTAEGIEQAGFVVNEGWPTLRLLVDATRLARQTQADAVDQLLDAAPAWNDPELALLAHSARFEAARLRPDAAQEALLARLEQEDAVQRSVGGRARWQNWLGILRFRQRRFAEAAQIHAQAAPHRATELERLTSLTNAARAWIAAERFEPAAYHAEEVRRIAARLRLPNVEAQAEWLLRTIANRREETIPDPELPAIIERLGDLTLTAQAYLTESYIAWRGQHPVGRSLAARAERAFVAVGMPHAALQARVIAWTYERSADPGALVAELRTVPDPGVQLDGLGVLASGGARLRIPPDQLHALILAQPTPGSPYPYGALTTTEALRRIHLVLEFL